MTWQTCPRCGSPCLIFVQPRCVFTECVWYDPQTYEDWRRSPFESEPAHNVTVDPWARTEE